MDLLTFAKHASKAVCAHPGLAGWYLRNRLRVACLPLERRNGAGVSRFARGITLKPTFACNLRCRMCSFAASGAVHSSPTQALPLDPWIRLVDDVAPYRPYITFTGGEPLLYPHVDDLFRHIHARGLFYTLTTNGTLLARHTEALLQCPPDAIVVSLDGPQQQHDYVRAQPHAFARATTGIRAIQELKKERRQALPFIIINSSITRHSFRRVDEVIEVAQEVGALCVNFQFEWSLTREMVERHNARYGSVHPVSYEEMGGMEPMEVDPREVMEAVQRIRRRIKGSGVLITFHPELSDDEVVQWFTDPTRWIRARPPVCAWMNTDVLPNGDVSHCFGLVSGNITRESFVSIWNNESSRAHRRRLAEDGPLPVCVRCCAFFRRD